MAEQEWTTTTLHTDRSTLLQCPFCAAQKQTVAVEELAGAPELEPSYYVRCDACGARGPACHTRRQAEAAWNVRLEAPED